MNTFLLQVNQIPITTQTQVQPSTSTYVPQKQIKTEKEMITIIPTLAIGIFYILIRNETRYLRIKYPTTKPKYKYYPTQI
jgi:hypothetical protein